MKRWAVAVVIAVLSGTAQAQDSSSEDFGGWSKDGSYWLKSSDEPQGLAHYLCATDPWTWPKVLGAEAEDGGWGDTPCQRYSAEEDADDPVPPALLATIVKVTGTKKPPPGLSLTFDKKASKKGVDQFVIKSPVGNGICLMANMGEIRTYFLRADGKAFAVEFIDEQDESRYVVGCDLTKLWTDVPSGDRKAATAANARGMKLYKAKKWVEAAAAFAEAVRLDDSFPAAHYDLASIAGIVGDLPVVRRELTWLSKSRHPEAVRLFRGARYDVDLNAAKVDPAVRDLMNIGGPSKDVRSQMGDSRVWSRESGGCDKPQVVLELDHNNSFKLAIATTCNGKSAVEKASGKWRWSAWEQPVVLSGGKTKRLDLDGKQITSTRCSPGTLDNACLAISGTDLVLHPGQPEVTAGYKR